MKNLLKIYFNNIKNPFLKRKISKIFNYALNDKLIDLGFKNKAERSNYFFETDIKFASKEDIRKLNKKFRKIDKETDVLSLPLTNFQCLKNYNLLGDIIICKKIAKLQARKFKHNLIREICFLGLHGFLHLLGHNHTEKIDEEIMDKKSKETLDKYKVKR